MYKVIRNHPIKIETTLSQEELISLFPIETQPHPSLGTLNRVWKIKETSYSTQNFKEDQLEFLSTDKKHVKVKTNTLKELLKSVEEFQIVLFYQDKKDIYLVKKV